MTKPTKPRAKVRKPKPFVGNHYVLRVEDADDSPKYLRQLAAWLLKAADYLEAKEKGGGRHAKGRT